MSESQPPRVFVSHASEDKDRFVTEFARKLRANGIDAWLDKWEMLPGDSLVDKIFEEGLKDTSAVIVVLSSVSVTKPWVREEMNAAFVKRVNQTSKLIPILIDDCEVPECLKSTVWQRIGNLESYDAELQRIIMAILGQTDRPPLGAAPKYTTADILPINGLTKLDALVFSECCRLVLTRDHETISRQEIFGIGKKFQIPDQEIEDSVLVLADHMYLKTHAAIGCTFNHVDVRPYGMERYLEVTRPDLAALVERVALKIVNEKVHRGADLYKAFNEPVMVFKTVIHILEGRGLIRATWYIGGAVAFHIMEVSPKLRRALQQ